MNKREMKKELMDFLIREWLKDNFAHVKFLHFINTDSKKVSDATKRRIEEITDDLAFKHSDIIGDFDFMPARK
jgi:hypothetical protein